MNEDKDLRLGSYRCSCLGVVGMNLAEGSGVATPPGMVTNTVGAWS